MEYIRITNSWSKSIEIGDIDGALKNIQIQIATNLMEVHNKFSSMKLKAPADVFAYEMYGKYCSDDKKDQMRNFEKINYRFNEISHSFDYDSLESKEEILENFQEIERILEIEMSKI